MVYWLIAKFQKERSNVELKYRKMSNNWDTQNKYRKFPKMTRFVLQYSNASKHADGMVNSVHPGATDLCVLYLLTPNLPGKFLFAVSCSLDNFLCCIFALKQLFLLCSKSRNDVPPTRPRPLPPTHLPPHGFDTRSGNILSFLLPLFHEGQLSVTGESMCTKYWLTA